MQKEHLKHLRERILTFYNEAEKILRGEIPAPRMAIFHITYLCNHNCTGCEYAIMNSKYHRILTKDEVDNILDQLIKIGIKGLEFSGGGEPLMYPYIADAILKLHKNNISAGILTNGSKLNGGVLKNMVKYGSYIRVSLESGSREIFEKVKRTNGKDFDEILNNLKEAVKLKKELNSNVDISIKFTVGKENYRDMENAIKLAMDIGVDSIQFKLYSNVDVSFRESDGVLKKIQEKLNELKEKYNDKITVLGDLMPIRSKVKCWLSPIHVTIDALGDIYVCPSYRQRTKTHCIGNMLKESFSDLWFSEKHKRVIENIKKEECDKYDCRFHFYNEFMEDIMKDKGKINFI